MRSRSRRRHLRGLLRLAVSGALLFTIARVLDVGTVIERFRDLRASWVALGLGITVAQVALLAWRWRYTADRLGIDLPLRTAWSEYYLSLFLNQVLPGGVTGDVSRAWRHARTSAPTGTAVRAVVLERASAQVVMSALAVVSFLALPVLSPLARVAVVGALVAAVAAVWALTRRAPTANSLADRVWKDTQRAVLSREALWAQLVTSALVVGSYVATYLVAARAVGIDTPFGRLLPLVAPVLMTMLIPVSVAGWGLREGAAAGLWRAVGLTPEDGVAISVAYGLMVLLSSAPGGLALARIMLSDPGRTARPGRAETGDSGDGAHRPA